uniref:Uncharacterized protein n=1 Tax=Utricularia reniformis TaxID=192314 RepID=A0A1Y0B1Y5_9LAMI|nr:hypothetical protein AEK19_MT1195 [Utricularia reniformis]ART31407.1 hypothetical protein AEK19_MT1195 [Utricularia reniformis]
MKSSQFYASKPFRTSLYGITAYYFYAERPRKSR